MRSGAVTVIKAWLIEARALPERTPFRTDEYISMDEISVSTFMASEQNPWDHDYKHRGRLWGGSVPPLPRLPHSSRILELGCGDGKTISPLVKDGYSVTAIDISPHAAALCRDTCASPDRARILLADAQKTPFSSGSFDVVTASHVTGHLSLDGRREMAGEVLRLLAPGGTLYFRDFSVEDFRFGRGEQTEAGTFMRKNGIITHYFTGDEVRALFLRLTVTSLVQHRWEMRVRGTVFPRAEIVAEFSRTA
jgi:MPBQ/MSBQ methyltransferase